MLKTYGEDIVWPTGKHEKAYKWTDELEILIKDIKQRSKCSF